MGIRIRITYVDLFSTVFFLGTGFLLIFPVFSHGFFVAHDMMPHLNWSQLFADQFWAGDFYPRWLTGMNGGRGSPVFFFYGPVPFFFNALIQPLFSDAENAWLILGCSYCLALGLSGLFTYRWLSDFTRPVIGFAGALLYLTSPFHLPVEVFIRFGFSEFWALAWVPLVLHQTRKAAQGKSGGVINLGIVYSLLIMTHLPATLILSPFLLAYGLIAGQNLFQGLSRTGIGLAIGAGLASFYLLPAVFFQKWIQIEQMTRGHGHFSRNFLLTGEGGPSGGQGFWNYLHFVTVYSAVMAIWGFFMIWAGKHKPLHGQARFWSALVLASFFMMLPWSFPVWNTVPILQKIQFPWRFHVLLVPGLTALVTIGMASFYNSKAGLKNIAYLTAAVFIVAQVVFIAAPYQKLLSGEIGPRDRQIIHHGLKVREGVPEYLPRWVGSSTVGEVLDWTLQPVGEGIRFFSGRGGAAVKEKSPRRLVLETYADEKADIIISQFYFPLWRARIVDSGKNLTVKPSSEGLLLVAVPGGNHKIELILGRGAAENLGALLSLATLGGLILWLWVWENRRSSPPPPKRYDLRAF